MKKVLRKATAIAASASFIGATMLGAVAQDLAQYPAPFVKDGVFDAFIVVGANAQTEDVIGAVDIGASLQFALKKATSSAVGAADATIDQGVKIQKSGQKMNYGDSVDKVLGSTTLAEDDLPTVLADGKFVESEGTNKNSADYTQNLRFGTANTANLTYYQDDELAPIAGDYVLVGKNDRLYNYSVEFGSEVDYDNTSSTTANNDFKTATIALQGKTYTITDVTLSSGNINKITMLSGEAVLWLTQNNPIKKSVNGVEHTIEVLDVTEDADACQVKVDDVTAIIDVDSTKTINGVQIGITDVRAIHAQLQDVDVCQVSVGASEIQLIDGDEVKLDDVELDGTKAVIDTVNSGEWDGFWVEYTPKDMDDDKYLASGQAFTDPIFSSWKLAYGGLSAAYEEVSLKTTGDHNAKFTFINNDGKTVELPIYYDSTNARIYIADGADIDDRYYADQTAGILDINDTCIAVTSSTECEGMRVIATTTGGEVHVFEITDINFGTTKNTTDIEDVTYGRKFDNLEFNVEKSDDISTLLNVGSFGTLNLSISAINVTVRSGAATRIGTRAGGSITITNPIQNNVSFNVSELDYDNDKTIPDETVATSIRMEARIDATDTEIDTYATVPAREQFASVALEDESDYTMTVTRIGSIVKADTENKDSAVLQLPKAEVYGNVFVAPIVAQLSSAGSGVTSYTLSKLNVGAAKLDTEISDVSANNLIVVGGPCANSVAKKVLGITGDGCGASSGIAPNTGIIKAVAQSGGKVALVVAGYEAADTKRATRVLANYDAYKADLTGSSVVVTGTSLADIKVTKSA